MEHDAPGLTDVHGTPDGPVDDGGSPSEGREGRAHDMITTAPTQTRRVALDAVAGFAVGAVVAWRTGLFSAFISGFGLCVLAFEDFRSRRIPKRTFDAAALSTLVYAALDASVDGQAARLPNALITTAVVGAAAALIWYVTSGIAFGDVKLFTLAAFIPAWLGGGRVLLMIGVSLLAAIGMVIFERVRNGPLRRSSTIAFGPPLLVGWLVGVLVT